MNAERLHAIALAIRADLQATKTVDRLQQLKSALQQQVNQPQQPAHQQKVSEVREELRNALSEAPSNSFTPAWRQVLDEIGATDVLGLSLLAKLDNVFTRNQITPSVALEEITELHKEAAEVLEAVQQLTRALSQLSIGSEKLTPGECELGVLVPRDAVDNSLDAFGRELVELNKTFATFAELAIGTRPNFEIRTVSSTDFAVFLDLAPKVAACIAVAVERVVKLYKELLEIRRLRTELDSQGVPEKNLKSVDEYANTHMEKGIEGLIGELIERYADDMEEGRRNELRTELKISLNRVANRIDRGYNVDVRVEPLPEPDAEDGEDVDPGTRDAVESIQEASEGLQFLKPTGRPILSLPEPDSSDADDEE